MNISAGRKGSFAWGGSFFIHLLLILFFVIFTFPFYYMFVLASWENIFSYPPHLGFGPFIKANWNDLFSALPFVRNYLTSFGIAAIGTAATVFFCTMGGFAFAKYQFRGKQKIFAFIMLTLAIPGFLNIIPFFKMMVAFGWYNTWLPLIVPGMANAFGIFLMSQFIQEAVPYELMDAARMDGLSEFGILIRMVFPLSVPGIAVLGTVSFIGSWNNFLGALVMLPDPRKSTIPVALSSLFVKSEGNFGGMMLGNALAVLPLILVFLVFSGKIIKNMTEGAVKG